MTTIAYKDGILVADRTGFFNNVYSHNVTKLFKRKSDGALISFTGEIHMATAYIEWFLAGEHGEAPSLARASIIDEKDTGELTIIIVRPNGAIEEITQWGTLKPTAPMAWGRGWEFAIGAMEAGATAKEAVRIATERVGGNPHSVDAMTPGVKEEVVITLGTVPADSIITGITGSTVNYTTAQDSKPTVSIYEYPPPGVPMKRCDRCFQEICN